MRGGSIDVVGLDANDGKARTSSWIWPDPPELHQSKFRMSHSSYWLKPSAEALVFSWKFCSTVSVDAWLVVADESSNLKKGLCSDSIQTRDHQVNLWTKRRKWHLSSSFQRHDKHNAIQGRKLGINPMIKISRGLWCAVVSLHVHPSSSGYCVEFFLLQTSSLTWLQNHTVKPGVTSLITWLVFLDTW